MALQLPPCYYSLGHSLLKRCLLLLPNKQRGGLEGRKLFSPFFSHTQTYFLSHTPTTLLPEAKSNTVWNVIQYYGITVVLQIIHSNVQEKTHILINTEVVVAVV